jgi:hypothetical protein
MGKYLELKEEGVDVIEHADRFWYWLKALGTPGGHIYGIVHSIAERLNVAFPNIYNADAFGEVTK